MKQIWGQQASCFRSWTVVQYLRHSGMTTDVAELREAIAPTYAMDCNFCPKQSQRRSWLVRTQRCVAK